MTASINIYKLPQVVNLTWAPTVGDNLMNYSATRSDFKLLKGITNEVHFFIKNTDREATPLNVGDVLEVVITDQKREHNFLTKSVVLVDAPKAIYKMTLTKEETQDWPLGTLSYSVLINRSGVDRIMLYNDRGYGAYSTIEVLSGPFAEPRTPLTVPLDEFLTVDFKLMSGAYAGGGATAIVNPAHSVNFYVTDFTGKVTLQASLDEQPGQDDSMWFEASSFETEDYTGPIYVFSAGNYLWVRFVVEKTDGTFEKVVLQR